MYNKSPWDNVFWKNKTMKKSRLTQIMTLVSSVIVSIGLFAGCASYEARTEGPSGSGDEMTIGWRLSCSFPDGAPLLNKQAELLCTVDTDHETDISGMSLRVSVDLPEGLQLVSGNLSWEGQVVAYPNGSFPTVRAIVRSDKKGKWQIRVYGYLLGEHPGITFLPGGFPVYLDISDDTAEWSLDPPLGSPLPTVEPIPSDYPTPPSTGFSREIPSPVEIQSHVGCAK
jgi:hypothetical protein